MTQAQCAERLGVSQATVSKLEAGEMRPSFDLAVRIDRETAGEVPFLTWATHAQKHGDARAPIQGEAAQ